MLVITTRLDEIIIIETPMGQLRLRVCDIRSDRKCKIAFDGSRETFNIVRAEVLSQRAAAAAASVPVMPRA